jgi:hypothetical protein
MMKSPKHNANERGSDPTRTEKKMPGRLEDPNERRGTEWTPPEGDPAKEQPNKPEPVRREPDPERKVSRVEPDLERERD